MKKTVWTAILIAVATMTVLHSCKKETDDNNTFEPITLVKPDSATTYLLPTDTLPIQLKFTTDRPITWVKGMYEVNATGATPHTYTYPDTLFALAIDTLRTNQYEYSTVYRLPDTLQNVGAIVRFKINMKAQDLSYEKQFKIVLN